MALPLRPYQRDIVTEVQRLLAQHREPVGVVAATGLGKTVTAGHLIAEHVAANPRHRVAVWVHRDELATQMRNSIHAIRPELRPGIVMGSQRDHDRQVVVASIQTVSRSRTRNDVTSYPRRDQIHGVGLQIADECHHAAAPSWRDTLTHFGAGAGVPTVGFTATMKREDNRGLGEIWRHVVKRPDGGNYDTLWGIRNGFLCDVRGIRVKVPRLDLRGVHVRAGDLAQEETATAMLDANTGEAIVKAIQEFAPERRGVVFAPNVATALDFAEAMNTAGIATGTILGETPRDERARIYAAYQSGELQWLTNAMVLTEGWDAPWTDALVIARPTKSSGLYQQMIGRGLRRFAGKQDCLVLDVCGATEIHGLASLIDLSEDGRVKLKDGQSLLEAEDEFDFEESDGAYLLGEEWKPEPAPVHSVVGTEVDMFGNSRSVWLQTHMGSWFIPAGTHFFFLWPNGGGEYLFGMVDKSGRDTAATPLHDQPVSLEIGMALAEAAAEEWDPEITSKNAAWRLDGPVTFGQKRDLTIRNLKVRKTMTAAQAYDEINIYEASQRLDV